MKSNTSENCSPRTKDFGPKPFIVNIDHCTKINSNYRTALWTGEYLQVTLMCIPVGGEIGLEIHHDLDQFICIVDGSAVVKMGKCKDSLKEQQRVGSNCAVIIPACTWHNIVNNGRTPLKLYSVYAPPQHPFGTVHKTKAEADAAEE